MLQINEEYIITAAHCVYNWTPGAFMVTTGDENTNPEMRDSNEEMYKVQSFETHPNYANGLLDHDLAIVRLNRKVQWSMNAQPMCLSNEGPKPGTSATLVGWGYDSFKGASTENLHIATMPIWSNKNCQNSFDKRDLIIKNGHVCAGKEEGGVDGCKVKKT